MKVHPQNVTISDRAREFLKGKILPSKLAVQDSTVRLSVAFFCYSLKYTNKQGQLVEINEPQYLLTVTELRKLTNEILVEICDGNILAIRLHPPYSEERTYFVDVIDTRLWIEDQPRGQGT
jgi:hypothetical protein